MTQEPTLENLVLAVLAGPGAPSLSTALRVAAPVAQQAAAQVVKLTIPAFAARSQQPAGAEALWSWLERAPTPDWQAVLRPGEAQTGRGGALLAALLGHTYDSRMAFIGRVSGMAAEAMPLLVDAVVAATLGVLREQAAVQQLDAEGISHWLQRQPGALPQLPPAGAAPPPAPVPEETPTALSRKKHFAALRLAWQALRHQPWPQYGPLLVLPALVLGFGLGRLHSLAARRPEPLATVLALKSQSAAAPPVSSAQVSVAPAAYVTPAPEASPAPATPPAPYATGPDIYLEYPGQPVLLLLGDGTSQRVPTRSTEYQLYRLLASSAQPPGFQAQSGRWIPVDQVYFRAGQASLPAAARQQLQNLASILRAFPRACFQIKGYSDSLDGYQAASRLSESRAWAAVKTLRELGIAGNRLQVRASEVSPELTSSSDEAGNVYQPYLSLQFVGNLPAGVIVPRSAGTGPGSGQAAAAASAARAQSARTTQATARRAAQLRRLRAKKQHRTKTRLWFRRLGQRLRGQRASR